MSKKENKAAKGLIKISMDEGHGHWNTDYTCSLRDLHLDDLVEEDGDPNHVQVSISLFVQKHAGFGVSVEGTIATSFTRKCSNCFSPYSRKINTNFNVWVLPSPRGRGPNRIPELGSHDPSVVYTEPGCEADLDSVIQDAIRLTSSVNETCSEFCEKSESGLQYVSNRKSSSSSKRWSKLLELKTRINNTMR